MGIEEKRGEEERETLKAAALMKDSNYFSIVYLREGQDSPSFPLDLALNSQFRNMKPPSLPLFHFDPQPPLLPRKLRSLPISEIGGVSVWRGLKRPQDGNGM